MGIQTHHTRCGRGGILPRIVFEGKTLSGHENETPEDQGDGDEINSQSGCRTGFL